MTDSDNEMPSGGGYEKKDVSISKVVITIVISVISLAVILLLLNSYFAASTEEQIFNAVLKPESAALRELRAREEETLNSYGRLDSAAGIYRIPIDRAMQLMADEAFRATEKPTGEK